jgi:hypothetical protein
MEIRTRSKTGPVVPSVGDITANLSQQVDAMKPQWLDQLACLLGICKKLTVPHLGGGERLDCRWEIS